MFYWYDMIVTLRQKKQRGEKVKADRRIVYISLITILLVLITFVTFKSSKLSEKVIKREIKQTTKISIPNEEVVLQNVEQEKQAETNIVYDGMSLEELTNKLNNNLPSVLSGTGNIYATKAIELGVDPYLAVSITLHETGCTWNCSTLVTQCNNVGGMKGYPTCGGGSYKYFPTLEEGIEEYMDNLYNNYVAFGLNTPELMNSKYAESTTWATQVNSYIDKIKVG